MKVIDYSTYGDKELEQQRRFLHSYRDDYRRLYRMLETITGSRREAMRRTLVQITWAGNELQRIFTEGRKRMARERES